MLKTLALIVIAVVAVALLYAATRPDTFRVERSIRINATPDKIAPLVSDFHQWEKWSPWEKIDPSLTRTYSGAASGQGAVYAWAGNKDIGQGRMEVVEAASPAKVLIKLDFITPFEAHNLVEFTLTPEGNATVVTQAMYGPSPFVSKVMGLVFSMDKMVGGKYEEGLQSLKALAEK
jgi:Polyketide cyclase / dehydrase and lipid transport